MNMKRQRKGAERRVDTPLPFALMTKSWGTYVLTIYILPMLQCQVPEMQDAGKLSLVSVP